jgi:type IV secretory pathway VirB6-like protein
MSSLADTLTILSAMFTPAVLVSACASLILTTSQRLSRSIDRQREVASLLRKNQQQTASPTKPDPDPAAHTYLTMQLSFAARRARLLQQVMTTLHLTLGIFIASIFSIGVFELINSSATWVVAALSVLGASLLLYASILLIRESRLAVADVAEETAYLLTAG